MSLEDSLLLDHVRTAATKPLRGNVFGPRFAPTGIEAGDASEGEATITRECEAAGRWEEYCDEELRAREKRRNAVREFLQRVKDDFPAVVSELLGDLGNGIVQMGFLWGNLGGGMFCNSFFRAAQARRKEA